MYKQSFSTEGEGISKQRILTLSSQWNPLTAPTEGGLKPPGEKTKEENQSLRLDPDNIGAACAPDTALSSLKFLPRTKREKMRLVWKPPSLYNYTLLRHSLHDSSLTQERAARFKITLWILSSKGISGGAVYTHSSARAGVLVLLRPRCSTYQGFLLEGAPPKSATPWKSSPPQYGRALPSAVMVSEIPVATVSGFLPSAWRDIGS